MLGPPEEWRSRRRSRSVDGVEVLESIEEAMGNRIWRKTVACCKEDKVGSVVDKVLEAAKINVTASFGQEDCNRVETILDKR